MEKIAMVSDLLKTGISKYRIAKEVGVSWNTVNLWSKGVWKPSTEHQEAIKCLQKKSDAESEKK